jgi:hypothetical protein
MRKMAGTFAAAAAEMGRSTDADGDANVRKVLP